MIPEANLGGNLQTKVSDGIAGGTAFIAMVGSAYRTGIEHGTSPAERAVEYRMEGTTGAVVAA